MPDDLEPGILLVVRSQLEEAAAAMDAALRRAAWSAAIGRHGGSAAGYYAISGSLLVGGRESHPLLLESAAEALAFLSRHVAATGWGFTPGDLYGTNDPRCHAAGLEDLILASPLVQEGRPLCFVALTASHAALGRASLAPVESLRGEGVILPWLKLGAAGHIQTQILDLLAANAEAPAEFHDDLLAQMHALRTGREALEALLNRYGVEILARAWNVLGDGCRRALQGIVGGGEAGLAEARVATFTVRVKADGEWPSVAVEAPGPSQRPPLTPALARPAVRAALREVLTAEAPAMSVLGGWDDAARIELPWDASPPDLATGAARFAGAQELANAVLAALAQMRPHLARAPDGSAVLMDLRGQRADGTRYRMRLELGAGLGASVFGDALSHAAPPFQPQRLRSVEAIERAIPVRIRHFGLRTDSAGPGQYRGGLGAVLELELLEGRADVDVLLPGGPRGLRGGLRGAGGRLLLRTPEEGVREEHGPAQLTLLLRAGHCLALESPGGGGWGIPFQRSIMRIEEDLTHGLISRGQCRNRYGVILQPDSLEKDDHLTYRVRHYLLSMLTADDIIAGEELLD